MNNWVFWEKTRFLRNIFYMKKLFLFFLLSLIGIKSGTSQISSNLSFSLSSGPFLPVDANNCGVDLPTAYLVSVAATNNGSAEINVGTLGLDSMPSGWRVIGPSNAEYIVGKIPAGETRTAFYFVAANCADQGNTVNIRFTANNGTNTQYYRPSITVEGIISANSAGAITSKIASLDILGSVVYDTITYSFSGFKSGNHMLMNPSSLVTFKASLLKLVESEVIAAPNNIGLSVGDKNKTYFTAGFNAQGSTAYDVTQVFKWRVVGFGDSTMLVPMSANQQGGTNIKGLVGDSIWGTGGKPIYISQNANTITMAKYCDKIKYNVGDTLVYSLVLKTHPH